MDSQATSFPGMAGRDSRRGSGHDEWRSDSPALSRSSSTNRLVQQQQQQQQRPPRRGTNGSIEEELDEKHRHESDEEGYGSHEKSYGKGQDGYPDDDNHTDTESLKPRSRITSWSSSSTFTSSSSPSSTTAIIELDHVLHKNGLLRKPDGEIGWDFDSPHCTHPRSWSMKRKLWDFVVIAVVEAFVLGMSAVGAPIGTIAEEELGISSLMANFVFTSTYLFGQAVGVIIVPASESFGRKRVLVGGMFLFSCINLALGLKPSIAVIAACRFLTGMLAAIPMNGIFGSMAELWNYKDRLWLGWMGAVAANAGIIMGPAFSETISEDDKSLGWHWVFNIAAIVGLLLTAVLCTTFESRPSVLLREKTNRVRELLRDPSVLPVSHPDHVASMGHFAREHMARPFLLLVTERVILFVSLLIGMSFAMIFLFLEAIPLIFDGFGMGSNMSTLPFLGLVFGLVFSTYTRMYDHFAISRHLESHLGKNLTPELKLIGFLIGSWVFAFGLWLFSWTIPPYSDNTPMLATWALVMVGYGINEFDTVLTGYLMDAYLSYAGSALAALNFVRCITIGTCSVFAHEIFHGMNWNIAGSVLAAAASLFCIGPPLLIHYGERMRCRSKFAVFSAIITLEERIAGNTLTPSVRPTSPEQMI